MESINTEDKLSLNFSGLPVPEAVEMLRRLALGLLSELIDTTAIAGRSMKAAPQPDLHKYLLHDQIKKLAASAIWKVQYKRAFKRIGAAMRENLPRAMKRLITRTGKGKVNLRQWLRAANNRVAYALGGTKGNGLPDDLWALAAGMAWNDPGFKLTVSLKLYDWLRKQQVLVPYDLPVIVLHPNTFWILIALTTARPKKSGRWYSRKRRARVRTALHLQEEAKFQILSGGWASFWDQWLIQLTTQRWPQGYMQLDSRLCKAVMSLPLLNISSDSRFCSGKKARAPIVKQIADRIFNKLDGVRILKRPTRDFRRSVLMSLSHIYWYKEIPDFFPGIPRPDVPTDLDTI